MKTSLVAAALAATCLFAAPAVTSAAVTVPVTLSVNGGSLSGTFSVKKFQNINGSLFAVGTLSTTYNNQTGFTSVAVPVAKVNGVPTQSAASSVTSAADPAACPVLTLVLGPLNLNVLGLNVTLNQVTLNITAIPGAGNLLGNLLCDVAGLLDSGSGLSGILDEVVSVLNQILAAL